MADKLYDNYMEYGHICFRSTNPVSKWMEDQRANAAYLIDEQREFLESVGFVWDLDEPMSDNDDEPTEEDLAFLGGEVYV